MIDVFRELFRRASGDETILTGNETIFGLECITQETADGYQDHNDAAVPPATQFGERSMRALSLILAFGFVLAGSSFAGAPDGDLPGIGTFQYSGSPVTTAAPQPIVLAAHF
ncbi:hypothetical protein SAMN05216330_104692 [Bradyrhizobium sp. Ghvi]|uniref:hypothetical protein n=1 Tax=Bradyrhizobium sp. Ghvi TaxID=1855319 RepID=UPI0008F0548A|nr:hypothetical protein [Bradyrhizobium sp. Ghvi]SFO79289.1 hypothetical protein SAMN05216330_104692 [Bradyrhizobium sp. Ghvi]